MVVRWHLSLVPFLFALYCPLPDTRSDTQSHSNCKIKQLLRLSFSRIMEENVCSVLRQQTEVGEGPAYEQEITKLIQIEVSRCSENRTTFTHADSKRSALVAPKPFQTFQTSHMCTIHENLFDFSRCAAGSYKCLFGSFSAVELGVKHEST